MHRIMIVDDEVLVRMGFRSIMDWESCGCTVVGDAAGGREALEKIPLLHPELIFVDLKMDDGDGFMLMKECAAKYPGIRFVVLSSYHDFDHVREALRLGAVDYVFKLDVKPEQLRHLLTEMKWAQSAQEEDPDALRLRKSTLITRLLTGSAGPESLQSIPSLFPALAPSLPFRLMAVAIDNYRLTQTTPQAGYSQSAIKQIESILLEVIGDLAVCCPFQEDQTVLICQKITPEELRLLQERFSLAADYIARYLNTSVTAVISEEHPSLLSLPAAYAENEQTLSCRYLLENGRIHSYHPISGELQLPPSLQMACVEETLRCGDAAMIIERFEAVFSAFSRSRGYPIEKLRMYLLELLFALKKRYPAVGAWRNEQGHSLERIIQYSDKLDDVRVAMERAFRSICSESGMVRPEVLRVLSYARTHLAEDISVAAAAREANLSESYFSHVFKRDMKVGFTEWLNRERILVASQLLRETDLRVCEIAERVGIDNPSYFSILFKKITGKTPVEERERRITKEKAGS